MRRASSGCAASCLVPGRTLLERSELLREYVRIAVAEDLERVDGPSSKPQSPTAGKIGHNKNSSLIARFISLGVRHPRCYTLVYLARSAMRYLHVEG
jgi:hypothetical protein